MMAADSSLVSQVERVSCCVSTGISNEDIETSKVHYMTQYTHDVILDLPLINN